jgi:hypothetical protein
VFNTHHRNLFADKYAGTPWIRLPFPVHVIERVKAYDHISRNRFVTTYAITTAISMAKTEPVLAWWVMGHRENWNHRSSDLQ